MGEWWLEVYEQHHRIWPGWSGHEENAEEAADFLLGWLGLGPGARALDLGCGNGREIAALSRRGLIADGVDVSPALADAARRRLADVGGRGRVWRGDYRTLALPRRYDLIYFWDSALNVFPAAVARATLDRLRGALRPGGWLVVEQLRRAWWSAGPRRFSFEDPALGPGRTERDYSFDERTGVLRDAVVWFPEQGPPEALPIQRLHLYPAEQLAQLLGEGAEIAGSDGWAWRDPPRPADAPDSRSICGRWRSTG